MSLTSGDIVMGIAVGLVGGKFENDVEGRRGFEIEGTVEKKMRGEKGCKIFHLSSLSKFQNIFFYE